MRGSEGHGWSAKENTRCGGADIVGGWRWACALCAGNPWQVALRAEEQQTIKVTERKEDIWRWSKMLTGLHCQAQPHTRRCGPLLVNKILTTTQCMQPVHMPDIWLPCEQRKGQTRPGASLNTANASITQEPQESKLTCIHHFICCNACDVCDERNATANLQFRAV